MYEILTRKTGSHVWKCKSSQHPAADAPVSPRLPAETWDHKILDTFDIYDSGSDSIRSSKEMVLAPPT